MRFTPRGANPLFDSLESVVKGSNMELVELSQSQYQGAVRIRVVVCGREPVGHEHCAQLHRALLPPLELAFPGRDLHLEVSSPGINRLIKDGSEFLHYQGRGIRCYRRDISGWSGGILTAADAEGITLKNRTGLLRLDYGGISKAQLDDAQDDAQEEKKPWQRI